MTIDKNFYNQASAAKLGWDPSWFGVKYFDESLTRAIKKWQKDHRLTADGLCGPGTFRRIWTARQVDIDDYKPENLNYSILLFTRETFTLLNGIKWYSGQSTAA